MDPLNKYKQDGNLSLPGLKQPVTVHRDEKGMAYIYARNLEDLSVAQGFIAAQDRLFQMELARMFSSGRVAELAGEIRAGETPGSGDLAGFHAIANRQHRFVVFFPIDQAGGSFLNLVAVFTFYVETIND